MSIMLFCGLILIASIDTADIDKHLWKWYTCIVFLKACFFYFSLNFEWLRFWKAKQSKYLSVWFLKKIIMLILLSMKWAVGLDWHKRKNKVVSVVLWYYVVDLCSILKICITSLVEDQLYSASEDNSLGSRHEHLLFSKIHYDTWAVTTLQWDVSIKKYQFMYLT